AANQRFVITEPGEADQAVTRDRITASESVTPRFSEVGETVNLAWTAREDEFNEFAYQKLLPRRFNAAGPAVVAGDLDGSGRDGVVIGGTTRDPLRVLVPDGKGSIVQVESPGVTTSGTVNHAPLLLFDGLGDG